MITYGIQLGVFLQRQSNEFIHSLNHTVRCLLCSVYRCAFILGFHHLEGRLTRGGSTKKKDSIFVYENDGLTTSLFTKKITITDMYRVLHPHVRHPTVDETEPEAGDDEALCRYQNRRRFEELQAWYNS